MGARENWRRGAASAAVAANVRVSGDRLMSLQCLGSTLVKRCG